MPHSEDERLHEQKGLVEAKKERAFAQFERGEFLSPEESRADMEQRKTNWPSGEAPDAVSAFATVAR